MLAPLQNSDSFFTALPFGKTVPAILRTTLNSNAEDLYARRIVGWSMQESMTSQLVVDALMMAVWRRGKPVALLTGIVHSFLQSFRISMTARSTGS